MLRLPCPAATAFPDLLLRRAPTKPPPPPTFSAVTASCFAFPARSHRLRTTSLSAHMASLPCARSPAPLTPSTGRHLHSTAAVGPSSPRLAARSSSALPPGARLPQPQTKPAATERAPSTAPAWSRSDIGGVSAQGGRTRSAHPVPPPRVSVGVVAGGWVLLPCASGRCCRRRLALLP
nr:formin-like protein 14 [Lolium perenne]